MMKSERSESEKNNLMEVGKKIDIDEGIKCNDFVNNS